MSKTLLQVSTFFICFFFSMRASAQLSAKEQAVIKQPVISDSDPQKKIKVLSIGDKMPDITLNVVNGSKQKLNLSEFHGKLVIFDFWATWCFSCISAFPKLEKLQQKYKDRLQVILVNSRDISGDTRGKVLDFIEKSESKTGKKFPLMISVEDTAATQLFPYISMPHCVWVFPSGIVRAITDGGQVNEENIQQILDNPEKELPLKRDFLPDQLMELTTEGSVTIDKNLPFYSVLKKGKIENLEKVNAQFIDKTLNVYRGIAMRNVPLLEMYEWAIIRNYNLAGYNRKRLILDVKEPSKLEFNENFIASFKEKWEQENLYSYNLVLPEKEIINLYKFMVRDLNTYTDFEGRVEKRRIKCLLLVEKKVGSIKSNIKGNAESIINGNKHYLKNAPGFLIASILNDQPRIKFPVINMSKTAMVDSLVLELDRLNIEEVKKQLSPFGLDLIESKQDIEMIIISDKK